MYRKMEEVVAVHFLYVLLKSKPVVRSYGDSNLSWLGTLFRTLSVGSDGPGGDSGGPGGGSETVFGTDVRNRQCSEQCSEPTKPLPLGTFGHHLLRGQSYGLLPPSELVLPGFRGF